MVLTVHGCIGYNIGFHECFFLIGKKERLGFYLQAENRILDAY